MGKTKTQTTSQTADPASQRFIQDQRQQAQQGADTALNQQQPFFLGPQQQTVAQQIQPFMNPFQSQVIDATRGEFDRLRDQATLGTNEAATRAGAFGGSRHGVAEGARLGELDRAQASQIANLRAQNFQQAVQSGIPYAQQQQQLAQQQAMEPLFRQRQALGFLNQGRGPVGQVTEQSKTGSTLGTLAGLGLTAAGAFAGGPAGASIGSNLGGFFGGGGQSSFPQPGGFQPPQFFPQGGGGGVSPFFGGSSGGQPTSTPIFPQAGGGVNPLFRGR